jgi:hypothetical protein
MGAFFLDSPVIVVLLSHSKGEGTAFDFYTSFFVSYYLTFDFL